MAIAGHYCPRPLNGQPSTRDPAEGCQSGRLGRSRKPLYAQAYREFESHPLRHRFPLRFATRCRFQECRCWRHMPGYGTLGERLPLVMGRETVDALQHQKN